MTNSNDNITIYCNTSNGMVLFLTDERLLRFFDNRDPNDWTLVK